MIDQTKKCALLGCDNNAEYISRSEMMSSIYCKRHFFEIYYGEDIVKAAEVAGISIESSESEIRRIVQRID